MIKKIYIVIILFSVLLVSAQQDSIGRKSEWLSHFAGIDFGYTSYDKIIGFKGETNINYVFNPYYFCAKIQLGIAPNTNFGTLKKAFVSVGFSTKTNKFLSWHLLTGLGIIDPSKLYAENINYPVTYNLYIRTFYFESGFYVKPKKNKRIIIGLNTVLHRTTVDDNVSKYAPIHQIPTLNFNLSLNLKINK
jgi:hypothetical protein